MKDKKCATLTESQQSTLASLIKMEANEKAEDQVERLTPPPDMVDLLF